MSYRLVSSCSHASPPKNGRRLFAVRLGQSFADDRTSPPRLTPSLLIKSNISLSIITIQNRKHTLNATLAKRLSMKLLQSFKTFSPVQDADFPLQRQGRLHSVFKSLTSSPSATHQRASLAACSTFWMRRQNLPDLQVRGKRLMASALRVFGGLCKSVRRGRQVLDGENGYRCEGLKVERVSTQTLGVLERIFSRR